jgi:uncharacterized protein GlcG (DUF336 family)
MFQKQCLSLTEARAAVEAVLAEALKAPAAPITVAVVDDYGRLVYLARMDGCPPVVVELAINKAYTAAVALMDSFAFAERDKAWGRDLATYGDPKFTYLQGGLVIMSEAEKPTLLGGIGVSGRMPDEDERLARIGLAAMR